MDKTIVHFEIPARDVEKLKKFYQELFGWKFTHTPMPGMDYWLIETVPVNEKNEPIRPGINGGMYKKENEMQTLTNWITVEDLDAYMKKIVELGGKIIVEKMQIPGVGWTGMGLDPEGNQVAIMQPEM